MGQAVSGTYSQSYAYRLNRTKYRDSEYLYDYYFDGYQRFTADARAEAAHHPNGTVFRLDVESFYTRIVQGHLVDETKSELRAGSERIMWLLRCLLCEGLPVDEGMSGLGIPQGGIASGFFANVYLASVDQHFGTNHPRQARLFRWVDDMILIVPDSNDADAVHQELCDKLAALELTLNNNKTETCSVADYLALPDQDDALDRLQRDFRALERPLWAMDRDYRQLFQDSNASDTAWWGIVDWYRQLLRSVGFHNVSERISRTIWQYLWDGSLLQKDLPGAVQVAMPPLQVRPLKVAQRDWATQFRALNPQWVCARDALHTELTQVFRESCAEFARTGEGERRRRRQLERRMRFTTNRLCRLGLGGIRRELVEVLRGEPWKLGETRMTVEALAQQGYHRDIRCLLDHYATSKDPWAPYMHAVTLRAIRYLREGVRALSGSIAQVANDSGRSAPERLLASETLLVLLAKGDLDNTEWSSMKADHQTVGGGAPLSARLGKNLLLLRNHVPDSVVAMSDLRGVADDPLFAHAQELVASQSVDAVLRAREPEVIRRCYYPGQYPDHIDDTLY